MSHLVFLILIRSTAIIQRWLTITINNQINSMNYFKIILSSFFIIFMSSDSVTGQALESCEEFCERLEQIEISENQQEQAWGPIYDKFGAEYANYKYAHAGITKELYYLDCMKRCDPEFEIDCQAEYERLASLYVAPAARPKVFPDGTVSKGDYFDELQLYLKNLIETWFDCEVIPIGK